MADAERRVEDVLQRVLLGVGILCLGFYGFKVAEARQFQREQVAAFAESVAAHEAGASRGPSTRSVGPLDSSDRAKSSTRRGARAETNADSIRDGAARSTDADATAAPAHRKRGVIAVLDIPRLKISTPVLAGDDAATLALGVGHLADTPRPWEAGNSALAAHRDGVFRPLRRVRVGDAIRVRTPRGDLEYRVRETRIVTPDDLSVLAPTAVDALTLITCYPFNFVGPAPQRFIVRADRLTP